MGIFTVEPILEKSTPEALVEAVFRNVKMYLDEDRFPVIIGGNHTVTIGAAKAFAEHYRKLSVLQLDAHADLRREYEGSPLNHACTIARISEFAEVTQVGIRSMSHEEVPYMNRSRIFFAHELYTDKSLYRSAIDMLTDDVYITIDLDVFDPSLMPSTGTPEPGGPDYYEIMHFLKEVIVRRNVVGFDVVELCPSQVNKSPDFVAARIVYQLLSYRFG
jgi:agmatinase